MSALINRVPTGRIISLHAELCYLYWRFQSKPFSLQEMKLDPTLEKTQLDFFPLAVNNPTYGRYNGKYDPYLDNPLDKAGFHLTQSTERDSQKSKSASECFTALEGLGWIDRLDDGKGAINLFGKEVANTKYSDNKFLEIIQKSVLNYGPFVGFLFECNRKSTDKQIKRKDVVIGYTNTNELVSVDGQLIPVSVGSQDDSITRTRSTLMAWAMTAGYLWPVDIDVPKKEDWHNEALSLLKNKTWTWTKFHNFIPNDLFSIGNVLHISRPLGYKWMTKSTKALREKGQDKIRNATMQIESKLKNRRFALVYFLALLGKNNKIGSFNKLITELLEYPDIFVVNQKDFREVMELELKQISITSGLVFVQNKSDELVPLVSCNFSNLEYGAPKELILLLESIYKKIQL
jgi:hypothetical protein